MSPIELTVLSAPGCPNAAAFEERLCRALAGLAGGNVRCRVIETMQQAAEAGMRGSPTLLIDGVDAFPESAGVVSLSCRLYRDTAGPADRVPSVQAFRRVLTQSRP